MLDDLLNGLDLDGHIVNMAKVNLIQDKHSMFNSISGNINLDIDYKSAKYHNVNIYIYIDSKPWPRNMQYNPLGLQNWDCLIMIRSRDGCFSIREHNEHTGHTAMFFSKNGLNHPSH